MNLQKIAEESYEDELSSLYNSFNNDEYDNDSYNSQYSPYPDISEPMKMPKRNSVLDLILGGAVGSSALSGIGAISNRLSNSPIGNNFAKNAITGAIIGLGSAGLPLLIKNFSDQQDME